MFAAEQDVRVAALDLFPQRNAERRDELVQAGHGVLGAVELALELELHVLDELVSPWTGEEGQPAFYRQIAQNDQRYTDEIQDRYCDITIPVSVHWGGDDEWIPPAKGAQLAATLPRSHFHLVPGAGHLVQIDAPGPVLDLVRRFLRETA